MRADSTLLHVPQISHYPTSVSSLAFSRDGSVMAVASSYCFEFGDQPHPADQLYLRRMQVSSRHGKAAYSAQLLFDQRHST